MTEQEILSLFAHDVEKMSILKTVAGAGLNDWWIGAGFVRNTVWEHLFGSKRPLSFNDIDVVYWKSLSSYEVPLVELITVIEHNVPNPVWIEEDSYVHQFQTQIPRVAFEVKNQARMHLWSKNGHERAPYASAEDGIADWVETATAVGIRLNKSGVPELCTPWGITDLVEGIVRPTRPELLSQAKQRAESKGWFITWPQLTFEDYEFRTRN